MQRMILIPDLFSVARPDLVPLTDYDLPAINQLSEAAKRTRHEIDGYLPKQVADGYFYGRYDETGRLLGIAGTHVVNSEVQVASLGNVFVRARIGGTSGERGCDAFLSQSGTFFQPTPHPIYLLNRAGVRWAKKKS